MPVMCFPLHFSPVKGPAPFCLQGLGLHPEIVKEIEEKKELPETLIQAIVKAAEEYKADRGR